MIVWNFDCLEFECENYNRIPVAIFSQTFIRLLYMVILMAYVRRDSISQTSLTVSKVVLIAFLSISATAPFTWYLSKKYYEGIRKRQKIFDQMQYEAGKTYPLWMNIILTSMILLGIQCCLNMRECLLHRSRRPSPMTLESIQHQPGWDREFHRPRR